MMMDGGTDERWVVVVGSYLLQFSNIVVGINQLV